MNFIIQFVNSLTSGGGTYQLLNHVINGISLGSVYAIIALGYTMVYGIAKMLNFAHGDVIMVGAYVCFYAFGAMKLPGPLAMCAPLIAIAAATPVGATIVAADMTAFAAFSAVGALRNR